MQSPKGFKAIFSYLFGSLKKEYQDFFEKYHPYDGPRGYIQTLENLVKKSPNLISLETPEASTEGRKIPIARLSSDHYTKPNKIMITGLIHGREFISGEVCLGILEEMIYTHKLGTSNVLENTEVYFLPVLNPDAFVYNVKKVRKGKRLGRLKRKNANGVDLNRNFDDNFEKRAWTNRYKFPIKLEYAGKHAFSEKETQFIKDFVESHQINGAINLHSASEVILYPPFSTKKQNIEMKQIAEKMCQAMPQPYTAVQGSDFIEHCTGRFSPIVTKIRHPTLEGSLDGWLYKKEIPSMMIEISKFSLALMMLSDLYALNPPPSSIPFHIENCFWAVNTFIEETKNYLKQQTK